MAQVAEQLLLASDTRGQRFESSHQQIFKNHVFTDNCIENMKIRKLRPEMAHSKRIKFLKAQLTQKRVLHKLCVSSHHVTYSC